MFRRLRRSISLLKKEGVRGLLEELYDFTGYVYWSATGSILRRTSDPRPLLWSLIRFRAIFSDAGYTDAYPFKILWVNPMDIDRFDSDVPKQWGRVIGGEWDQHGGYFTEKTSYQSLLARYQDGVAWKKTEKYQQYRSKLSNHQTVKGFGSVDELNAYYEGIDDLYEQIAKEGYKTQEKLLQERHTSSFERNNDAVHPLLNEIRVSIGRNGEFHKKGAGNHRLTIARLLEIELIPVLVSTRHTEWQAIRDEVAATKSYSKLSEKTKTHLQHPDLRDLTPRVWRERTNNDE